MISQLITQIGEAGYRLGFKSSSSPAHAQVSVTAIKGDQVIEESASGENSEEPLKEALLAVLKAIDVTPAAPLLVKAGVQANMDLSVVKEVPVVAPEE